MKHIIFEHEPDGLYKESCITTKNVSLKKGDLIRIHGVSSELDDVYLVDVITLSPMDNNCDGCPFVLKYTDDDGFNDWGCRLSKKMNGRSVDLCVGEGRNEFYTFEKMSGELEGI